MEGKEAKKKKAINFWKNKKKEKERRETTRGGEL